jgi:hypothetical protein
MKMPLALLIALMTCTAVRAQDTASDAQPIAKSPATPLQLAYQQLIVMANYTSELLPMSGPLVIDSERRPELKRPEFLDYVAEGVSLPQDPRESAAVGLAAVRNHNEVRSKLMLILDKYGNGRYHRVILRIAHESEPSTARKLARQLVDRKKTPADAYVLGALDLAAARDGYARAALAVVPNPALSGEIKLLRKRAVLDAVVERLGTPQAVTVKFWCTAGNPWQMLDLYYRGVGRVEFVYLNRYGWVLEDHVLSKQAFEPFMPYWTGPKTEEPNITCWGR